MPDTKLVKAKAKGTLTPEGSYIGTVTDLILKPNAVDPKKVVNVFRLDGRTEEVKKEVPFSFEDDSMLRRDAETLLGRQFTRAEAEAGLDLNTLVGKRANVVVCHRAGHGGKPIAVISLIQPLITER